MALRKKRWRIQAFRENHVTLFPFYRHRNQNIFTKEGFYGWFQELLFFKGRLRSINSVYSQLGYHRGGIRSRTAVFIKGMHCRIEPSFVTRDLVAWQIKIGKNGNQKDVVVRSAYFPSDFGTPPIPKKFKELVEYCAERKLELLTRYEANSHHAAWGSSDINSREEHLCEYLMARGPNFFKTIDRIWSIIDFVRKSIKSKIAKNRSID